MTVLFIFDKIVNQNQKSISEILFEVRNINENIDMDTQKILYNVINLLNTVTNVLQSII